MLGKAKSWIVRKLIKRIGGGIENHQSFSFPSKMIPISETTDDDVFIVGYPKSGNTLLNHIIAHLYYGMNENTSRTIINLLVPDTHSNSHYFRINEKCFFKSHDLPSPKYKNVIYVVRDGREALLSYYHMIKGQGKLISLEELYKGEVLPGDSLWKEHVELWHKNPYDSNILWVRYEDLINDKMEQLKRICKYLNLSRSKVELDKVVKFTSFDHMRKMEERFDWDKMKRNVNLTKEYFVRKGSISSYKNEVPNELIHEFEIRNKSALDLIYKARKI